MKFHHIGIACLDIEHEINNIKKFNGIKTKSDIVFDENQDAYLCLVETVDNVTIELISGKKVENLIKRGVSIYHVCYEVENIYNSIDELTGKGAIIVAKPAPAKLFDMKKVAFLNFSYALVELLEK